MGYVSSLALSFSPSTSRAPMSYPANAVAVVRQEGFQLPSPANSNASNSPSDPAPTSPSPPDPPAPFMHQGLSYVHDAFRKFPSAAQHHSAHQNATPTATSAPIDLTDELASLIDPHTSSHERSTHTHSPNACYDEPYRHHIFDMSAASSTHHHPHHHHHHPSTSSSAAHPFTLSRPATDMYPPSTDLPLQPHSHFNNPVTPLRFDGQPHPDPPHLAYRHTPSPSHRSRSRSRAPSVGPTRSAAVARRDRRASSISSHVGSTSPPPRPHPHAIIIPGRGNASAAMGGFFVPGQPQAQSVAAVQGGEFSLPTPESLSHSFGYASATHIQNNTHSHQHGQFPSYATPSSPYYPYSSVPIPRPGSPSALGISPDVETLGTIPMGGGTVSGLNMPTVSIGTSSSIHPSSLPANGGGILSGPPLSSISSTSSTKTVAATNGSNTAAKSLDPAPENQLSEKKKRRRESHNAVERRRRDNINERIGELAGLIPGVLFECDGMSLHAFLLNLLMWISTYDPVCCVQHHWPFQRASRSPLPHPPQQRPFR